MTEISGINPNQISPIEPSTTVNGTDSVSHIESTGVKVDALELSPEARQLQNIEQKLSALPEIDFERVNVFKEQIEQGNYHVDPARVADSLIQFEQSLLQVK